MANSQRIPQRRCTKFYSEASITQTWKPAKESTLQITTDLTHSALDIPKSQVKYEQIRIPDKMVEQKDLHTPPLTKTPKSQLVAELPLGAKKTGSYQKRYFTSKDREEAVRRWQKGSFHDIIKSHTCQVGYPQTRK